MRALWRTARVLLLGLSLASLSLCGASRFHIPPHEQVARVARFVAHQVDWASMATIATHKPVVGQPFSNVFSVSDGPRGSGSGVPYMYLTRMEISVQDLEVSLTRDISVKTGTESSLSEVHLQSVEFSEFDRLAVSALCCCNRHCVSFRTPLRKPLILL